VSYLEDLKYKVEIGERLAALSATSECRCSNRPGIWHTNCWRGEDCDTPHNPPPDCCEVCGGEIAGLQIIYVEDGRTHKAGEYSLECENPFFLGKASLKRLCSFPSLRHCKK
jgi:hypothetical protein